MFERNKFLKNIYFLLNYEQYGGNKDISRLKLVGDNIKKRINDIKFLLQQKKIILNQRTYDLFSFKIEQIEKSIKDKKIKKSKKELLKKRKKELMKNPDYLNSFSKIIILNKYDYEKYPDLIEQIKDELKKIAKLLEIDNNLKKTYLLLRKFNELHRRNYELVEHTPLNEDDLREPDYLRDLNDLIDDYADADEVDLLFYKKSYTLLNQIDELEGDNIKELHKREFEERKKNKSIRNFNEAIDQLLKRKELLEEKVKLIEITNKKSFTNIKKMVTRRKNKLKDRVKLLEKRYNNSFTDIKELRNELDILENKLIKNEFKISVIEKKIYKIKDSLDTIYNNPIFFNIYKFLNNKINSNEISNKSILKSVIKDLNKILELNKFNLNNLFTEKNIHFFEKEINSLSFESDGYKDHFFKIIDDNIFDFKIYISDLKNYINIFKKLIKIIIFDNYYDEEIVDKYEYNTKELEVKKEEIGVLIEKNKKSLEGILEYSNFFDNHYNQSQLFKFSSLFEIEKKINNPKFEFLELIKSGKVSSETNLLEFYKLNGMDYEFYINYIKYIFYYILTLLFDFYKKIKFNFEQLGYDKPTDKELENKLLIIIEKIKKKLEIFKEIINTRDYELETIFEEEELIPYIKFLKNIETYSLDVLTFKKSYLEENIIKYKSLLLDETLEDENKGLFNDFLNLLTSEYLEDEINSFNLKNNTSRDNQLLLYQTREENKNLLGYFKNLNKNFEYLSELLINFFKEKASLNSKEEIDFKLFIKYYLQKYLLFEYDINYEIKYNYYIHNILKYLEIMAREIPSEDINSYKYLDIYFKLIDSDIYLNQLDRYIDFKKYFNDLIKQNKKEKNDINKSYSKILSQSVNITEEIYSNIENPLIFESDQISIIQLTNIEQSCRIGQGTKWCTAASEKITENMFSEYHKPILNNLYVIIPTKKSRTYDNEKYQIDIYGDMLMNELDEEVNVCDLIKKYPDLKIFLNSFSYFKYSC